MHDIEILNKLLKNELLATEAYQQALNTLQKAVGMVDCDYITPIHEEHKNAVSNLQTQIRERVGIPCENLGSWTGTWAEIIITNVDTLGKEVALNALREGEKSGLADYEVALRSPSLPLDIRFLLEKKLLPVQQEHIRTLDLLLDAVAAV